MQCVQAPGGRSDEAGNPRSSTPNPRFRGDGAAALVEFAILLPVLALIITGVVDLSRAYHTKNQLKNAAREGAIYGQTHPTNQGTTGACAGLNGIVGRARAELQTSGQSPPKNLAITVSPSTTCKVATAGLASGNDLTVTASSTFDLFTPIIGKIVGSPITLTESVKVQIQ